MQGDEVGDEEEIEAGVEGDVVELEHAAGVGEGGGEVEVHFRRDADDATGAGHGEGRHRGGLDVMMQLL